MIMIKMEFPEKPYRRVSVNVISGILGTQKRGEEKALLYRRILANKERVMGSHHCYTTLTLLRLLEGVKSVEHYP